MRKYVILLLLILSYAGAILAQDTFYYCGGKKIPLKKSAARSSSLIYLDENDVPMMVSDYIYVKLKSLDDVATLKEKAEQYGLSVENQDEFMPSWFVLKKHRTGKGVVDVANALYETGLFAECLPDLATDGKEISYDPYSIDQWGLYNRMTKGADINVSEAWNYATGRGVVIAIVDEGIELTHIDLASNIFFKSYDARTGTSPSRIYGDHGTHCAGIAAAVRSNGVHIAGVAPDARLMSVSDTLDQTALAAMTHARGINWAWKNGADIISMSWSCAKNMMVVEAIDSALVRGRNGKGCVMVKSAGNGHEPYITFPGTCEGVIAVGNITKYGEINENVRNGSNYGDEMFISAPGTVIPSTVLNNKVDYYTGTSMAAPHVAGVAALMLERNPELSVWNVREILARTARKLEVMPQDVNKEFGMWDKYYGYGIVDAGKAVLESINYKNFKGE